MNFQNIATITGLATGVAISLTSVPAQAFTFNVEGHNCNHCVDLGQVYDVTGGAILDPAADKKNVYLTPGSDTKTAIDPIDDSDNVASYNVTSILDDPIGAVDDILVENLKGKFEFFWGSVDTYNLIEFFGAGGLVASLTGTDIANAVGLGGTDNKAGNFNFDAYVSFEGAFTSAKLSILPDTGTGIAFEVATEKVPEPASIIGLVAVGLLGGGSLLKRKGQVA